MSAEAALAVGQLCVVNRARGHSNRAELAVKLLVALADPGRRGALERLARAIAA